MIPAINTILQRSAIVAWALLLSSFIGLGLMVMDDSPPFETISYVSTPVKPGGVARFEAIVKRDLSRRCSVTFSRHAFDSTGLRLDLVPATSMTADALEGLERATPGRLRVAVGIPPFAAPGPARLVIPLSYVCNPWQAIRPIEMVMEMSFEILPP
jgi:hypothetical protein